MIALKTPYRIILLAGLLADIGITSCNNIAANKNNGAAEMHQVMIHKKGSGMLYVDKIPCNAVMQNTGGDANFHCYLVGIIDSLSMAKATDKKDIEAGKYYQFDMQHDWIALQHGDSLRPVFYQPKQKLQSHRNEGVLVFETVGNEKPDTLVYNDSHSMWGTQKIIINNNQ